jgi:hypothetical protein
MKSRLAKICLLLPLALLFTLAPQIFSQEHPMAITDTTPKPRGKKCPHRYK